MAKACTCNLATWWCMLLYIYSFLPLVFVSADNSCRSNNILQAFEFAYPTTDMLVPQNLHVKVSGEFFDPTYIVQNNALYSICVGLSENDESLQCSDQLFDEMSIMLPDQKGRHKILASFCPKNGSDCLCNISIWVECCAPIETVSDDGKPSEKTLAAIQQVESDLKRDLRENKSPSPLPWSCR
jgi:hypothetical protein